MVMQLTQEEGEFLVKLARKTVQEHMKTGIVINMPKDAPSKLMQRCGVFITINKLKDSRRELRGCIGYPYPTTILMQAVIECAIGSATQDPRFYPLSQDELDHIVFEVSLLTPPELMHVENPKGLPSRIKVGKDGLIVARGLYKGLLLPQVPVEYNWDEEEFLCQCCTKAGLPPDCWLMKTTKIYKFQCIIAAEISPNGLVEVMGSELPP